MPIDQSLTEHHNFNNFSSAALLELISAMGAPMPPKGIMKREIAQYANAVAHDGCPYLVTSVKRGACGVALAGNVPVRSVVSQGLQSGIPQSHTLFVHEATVYHPGDQGYMFEEGNPRALPTYHLLSRFRDADTGKVYTALDLTTHRFCVPDFVGLRGPNHDGFTLIGVELEALLDMGCIFGL